MANVGRFEIVPFGDIFRSGDFFWVMISARYVVIAHRPSKDK